MDDVVETCGPEHGPLLITCEHASGRIPAPLSAQPDDEPWISSHWGVDIGAAEVTRRLSRRLKAPARLARFSRLVCDANRPAESRTLILEQVEGHPLSFNRDLDLNERARRLRTLHAAYHGAVDAALAANLAAGSASEALALLSIHSFTPVLGQEERPMEAAVLFDGGHEALARRLAGALVSEGFGVALNEPYSGFDGLIYSVWRHGRNHDVPYLELELRQDLIADESQARAVARRVCTALQTLLQDRAPL
jgi:predicted N-formylglutamate amidohydrolase